MPGLGTVYLHSMSNKKCRASFSNVMGGVFMDIPDVVKKKLEEWKQLFGKLPTDLTFEWQKD